VVTGNGAARRWLADHGFRGRAEGQLRTLLELDGKTLSVDQLEELGAEMVQQILAGPTSSVLEPAPLRAEDRNITSSGSSKGSGSSSGTRAGSGAGSAGGGLVDRTESQKHVDFHTESLPALEAEIGWSTTTRDWRALTAEPQFVALLHTADFPWLDRTEDATKLLESAAQTHNTPGWLMLALAKRCPKAFEDSKLTLLQPAATDDHQPQIGALVVLLLFYGSTLRKGHIEFKPGDSLAFGTTGITRQIAEYLETEDGLDCVHHVLSAVPNVIAACMSVAMMVTQQSLREPDRAETYRRCAERLRRLATGFAVHLDSKMSQLSNEDQGRLIEATVFPAEILHMCVGMHDIDLVSVPWITEWVHVKGGTSLTFLYSEEWYGKGREVRGIGALTEMERLLPLKSDDVMAIIGVAWPQDLYRIAAYLGCASLYPLLLFRAPLARYWFNTGVYLIYVGVFTNRVALDDSVGDFTAARLYCWLCAIGTIVQEAVELLLVYSARDYFSDPWNLLQTSGSVMVLISLVMQDIYHDEWGVARPCLAWAALLLWMTTLQFFEQFPSTGPFISIIFRMVMDTLIFALIMTCLGGSFGAGLYILFRDDMDRVGPAVTYAGGHELSSLPWPYEFSTVYMTVQTMFRVLFGDFTFDFTGAIHDKAAVLMFGTFLGLVLM
jgi:hypothetical protein